MFSIASSKVTPAALRAMFQVSLDTRLEYVHPADVARAMASAVSNPEARSKVLMIGGGPSCQVLQRDLFTVAFESLGIGALPEEAFGDEGFEGFPQGLAATRGEGRARLAFGLAGAPENCRVALAVRSPESLYVTQSLMESIVAIRP